MTAKEVADHILECETIPIANRDPYYEPMLQELLLLAKAYLALDRKYAASLDVIEAARIVNKHWIENGQFGDSPDKVQIKLRDLLNKFQKETERGDG